MKVRKSEVSVLKFGPLNQILGVQKVDHSHEKDAQQLFLLTPRHSAAIDFLVSRQGNYD